MRCQLLILPLLGLLLQSGKPLLKTAHQLAYLLRNEACIGKDGIEIAVRQPVVRQNSDQLTGCQRLAGHQPLYPAYPQPGFNSLCQRVTVIRAKDAFHTASDTLSCAETRRSGASG